MRQYYVYILSSRSRRLYVGVTNDLLRRVAQQREAVSGLTAKYRVRRLVYWELANRPIVAIAREKQIKAYRREKKIALITELNPGWDDRSESFPSADSSSRSLPRVKVQISRCARNDRARGSSE